MGEGLPVCAKCGHAGYSIESSARRCLACGSLEPVFHGAGGGRRAGSRTAGPAPTGSAHARTRARAVPATAGPATARMRPHPSTFGHLSMIIGEANTWPGLMDILKRAGAGNLMRRGLSKQESLYGVLVKLHKSDSHATLIKVLEAACSPGTCEKATREKINEYLGPHGMKIGEDGKAIQVGRVRRPSDADMRAFDQRRYYPIVIEHARQKFLAGEYFGAVIEAYKALEEMVREASGLDDSGDHLMRRAFGEKGVLAVALPGLASETRNNLQRGLMEMCAGLVSSVRNPVSHESDLRFHMGREDALDILSTISYLCRQVEGTKRRRTRRTPPKDGGRGAGGKATGSSRAPRGSPAGEDPAERPGGEGEFVEGLEVRPELVGQGDQISVAVTGRGIGGWYAGVFTLDDQVKLSPTRLEALGLHERLEGGMSRYSFPVTTLGYRWGEYKVSVSSAKSMDARGACVKMFTVTTSEGARQAGEGARCAPAGATGRRVVR